MQAWGSGPWEGWLGDLCREQVCQNVPEKHRASLGLQKGTCPITAAFFDLPFARVPTVLGGRACVPEAHRVPC